MSGERDSVCCKYPLLDTTKPFILPTLRAWVFRAVLRIRNYFSTQYSAFDVWSGEGVYSVREVQYFV